MALSIKHSHLAITYNKQVVHSVGGVPRCESGWTPIYNAIQYHRMTHPIIVPSGGKSSVKRPAMSDSDSSSESDSNPWTREHSEQKIKIMLRPYIRLVHNLKNENPKLVWPFLEPVDAEKLGLRDYHSIVKCPMDLGTVYCKEETGQYTSIGQYVDDVRLVFSNAKLYNPPEQDCHYMAEALSKLFEKGIERLGSIRTPYHMSRKTESESKRSRMIIKKPSASPDSDDSECDYVPGEQRDAIMPAPVSARVGVNPITIVPVDSKPVKRPRGRPRKHPKVPVNPKVASRRFSTDIPVGDSISVSEVTTKSTHSPAKLNAPYKQIVMESENFGQLNHAPYDQSVLSLNTTLSSRPQYRKSCLAANILPGGHHPSQFDITKHQSSVDHLQQHQPFMRQHVAPVSVDLPSPESDDLSLAQSDRMRVVMRLASDTESDQESFRPPVQRKREKISAAARRASQAAKRRRKYSVSEDSSFSDFSSSSSSSSSGSERRLKSRRRKRKLHSR
eukprot:61247_1